MRNDTFYGNIFDTNVQLIRTGQMYNKQLGVWVDTASLAEVEVKGTRRTPNETLERNKEIFEKFIQRDLMMHRMEKPVPPPFSEKNIPPVNEPHIQAPKILPTTHPL